jgi:hypothetical protein
LSPPLFVLIAEKSKPVYNSLPITKRPKNKKKMDDEPVGRTYKKSKSERGLKQLKQEKSGKSKLSKAKNPVKRKGKTKKR